MTALSPLQQRILEVFGASSALYTRLCTISLNRLKMGEPGGNSFPYIPLPESHDKS